jgi:hypothetical protein
MTHLPEKFIEKVAVIQEIVDTIAHYQEKIMHTYTRKRMKLEKRKKKLSEYRDVVNKAFYALKEQVDNLVNWINIK